MIRCLVTIALILGITSCGASPREHRDLSYQPIEISVVDENSIFIRGYKEELTEEQFKEIIRGLNSDQEHKFVIFPVLGDRHPATLLVVMSLENLGVKRDQISVAKISTRQEIN